MGLKENVAIAFKEHNQLVKENIILRRLLWLKHGCELTALYGDDGEMQCNKCHIDFKRDSVSDICTQLTLK